MGEMTTWILFWSHADCWWVLTFDTPLLLTWLHQHGNPLDQPPSISELTTMDARNNEWIHSSLTFSLKWWWWFRTSTSIHCQVFECKCRSVALWPHQTHLQKHPQPQLLHKLGAKQPSHTLCPHPLVGLEQLYIISVLLSPKEPVNNLFEQESSIYDLVLPTLLSTTSSTTTLSTSSFVFSRTNSINNIQGQKNKHTTIRIFE